MLYIVALAFSRLYLAMVWCFEFKKTRYEDLRLDADVYPESGIVINHTLAYHGFMEFGR